MRTIIAIDPGASGGVAWHNGKVNAAPIPDTRGDLIALLSLLAPNPLRGSDCLVAYMEDNPDYVPNASPSTMCAYGRGQERPACILETLGVRIVMVRPQVWQKALNLGNSDRIALPRCPATRIKKTDSTEFKRSIRQANEAAKKKWEMENGPAIKSAKAYNDGAKRDWKNKLKAMAQRLFPGARVTLDTADALLLLEYAMRREGGGQIVAAGATKQPDLFNDTSPASSAANPR